MDEVIRNRLFSDSTALHSHMPLIRRQVDESDGISGIESATGPTESLSLLPTHATFQKRCVEGAISPDRQGNAARRLRLLFRRHHGVDSCWPEHRCLTGYSVPQGVSALLFFATGV